MEPDLWRRMGQAELKVVKAANYYNAGTVEFLVDAQRRFYFLEMNTRLQVEHPVTELVTGLDLVKLQIRLAAGEKLPIVQNEVAMHGASIECRIYAEDPENNFFPSPGKITMLRTPSGPGVRNDSGVYEGWTVPIEYDPLISKLATWGASRDEAVARMHRALREYHVEGIKTNIGFFLEVLKHPDFLKGDFDTSYIDRWLASRGPRSKITENDRCFAALAVALFHDERSREPSEVTPQQTSAWKIDGRRKSLRKF